MSADIRNSLHFYVIIIASFAISMMLPSCGGGASVPTTNSLAVQANLAWDPPDISTDVTGYMIHYGTASGSYSQAIDVGNTTSHTVTDLIDGQNYYFAVTAYNAVGYQSAYSNEVSIETATFSSTPITQPSSNAPLYLPHIDTSLPWQTEIAIINTGDQTVTGTIRGMSDAGKLVETLAVSLSAHGRRQITVANEFAHHTDIGYIIFDTDSVAIQGYAKIYQAGIYRAAIPAVKEVNTSNIYISHIDSGDRKSVV
jgi:hypothetical protein